MCEQPRRLRRTLAYALAVLAVLAVLLIVSTAVPVREWRTGESRISELHREPATPRAGRLRIWIDTDAACGTGWKRDADDCLALLSLLSSPAVEVAGISTTFGNAPLDVTHQVTEQLLKTVSESGRPVPSLHRGCGAPVDACPGDAGTTDAQRALSKALLAGDLVYVAMGPLTNLASLIRAQPQLSGRLSEVVAVMGRQPGHRFHPSEGRSRTGILFGHGPVFSDFNVAQDPTSVGTVLRAPGVRLVLTPYTAARSVPLGAGELSIIANRGPSGTWVAERSEQWLKYWNEIVGLEGFYPFDLMAAAYVLRPDTYRCATVNAWLAKDPELRLLGNGLSLLVTQDDEQFVGQRASGPVLFCDQVAVEPLELF